MSNYSIIEEISLVGLVLKKRSDKIIEYVLTDEYILDVEDIRLMSIEVDKMCNNEKFGMLVVTSQHSGTTREARNESLENMKKYQHAIAEAVVINSLPTRIAADFFYKIYKPNHPCKFFKTKEKAEEWLKAKINNQTVR